MSRRGNNIFKRKDGRWEGRYISGHTSNGKAKYSSVYAHSYSECAQKLHSAKSTISTNSGTLTIEKLFTEWLESKKNSIKPSTYMHYTALYRNHISPQFSNIRTERITTYMLNCYVSDLLKKDGESKLSVSTVQSIITLIKSMFHYGEITHNNYNPAKSIQLPRQEPKDIPVFNKYEMNRIREHALVHDSAKLGILLCLYTGMRIGEICALCWSDIDINEQIISVNKTIQRIQNPAGKQPKTIMTIDTPKSKKSNRKIPIPSFITAQLIKLKPKSKCDSYFLTGTIKYIEPRMYQERYRRFLKSIDIPYRNFHVLRHTFATECICCGIDVKTVSELLGHSSVKITLDRYVHSSMDHKRNQLKKLYSI